MQAKAPTDKKPANTAKPDAVGARSAEAPQSKGAAATKGALRGMGMAEQEASLRPPPHQFVVPQKGAWVVQVAATNAQFPQHLSIGGTDGNVKDQPVQSNDRFPVNAASAWTVAASHRRPDSKGGFTGPHPSTHSAEEMSDKKGWLVSSEDYKDDDFNDLVLKIRPADEVADGVIVSAETQVKDAATSYDVNIVAGLDGNLDVIVDYVAQSPSDIQGKSPEVARAVLGQLANVRRQIVASADYRVVADELLAMIGVYEKAAKTATGAGKKR